MYNNVHTLKKGLIHMDITQIKSERFMLRLTPKLMGKIDKKCSELKCTKTALLTSMIEHCFSEMEGK